MTLQISPVLAGAYDAPNYIPPSNLASTQVDDSDAVDSRRYTKFDRSATDAGSTTSFSFGDFLDMINPLEHIPVISSIYREATGDSINPVSRVVGDVLYGGILGVASAVIGGIGGAGDATIEQETGKDSAGGVIAALFEDDSPSSPPATQLAQTNAPPAMSAAPAAMAANQTANPSTTQTAAQTNAHINARAKLEAAAVVAATSSAVAASMPSTGISSPAAQMASASSSAGSGLLGQLSGNPAMSVSPLNTSKGFALDPKKLPYGGVMAPPLQGSNMALALANSAPGGLQMNHGVRLMNGVKPSAVSVPGMTTASATPDTAAGNLSSSPDYISTTTPDALPPSLMNDITALRAINQYRSTVRQSAPSGASVDVVN